MRPITQLLIGIVAMLLFHAIKIAVLGGLAMFVWNVGAVGLLPTLNDIGFVTAVAVITGIYTIDYFVKSYIKKLTVLYQLKKSVAELFKKM